MHADLMLFGINCQIVRKKKRVKNIYVFETLKKYEMVFSLREENRQNYITTSEAILEDVLKAGKT